MAGPLRGLKVVELAGLAPVPLVGKILADFGAHVIRVDRFASVFPDVLAHGKRSLALDLKAPAAKAIFPRLIASADVLLDPYRPGMLEEMELSPKSLQQLNSRLIVARLSGYGGSAYGHEAPARKPPSITAKADQTPISPTCVAQAAHSSVSIQRESAAEQRLLQPASYTAVAGHDINYLAMSGMLSLMQRPTDVKPTAPLNLLGDFGGGSAMAVIGILMALVQRQSTHTGCVVDASITAGTSYLSTLIFNLIRGGAWNMASFLAPGKAPFYDTYKCRDGRFVAVGSIEPRFYELLWMALNSVSHEPELTAALKRHAVVGQYDTSQWPSIASTLQSAFGSKPLAEWVALFHPSGPFADACVTPVLYPSEGAAFAHGKGVALVSGAVSPSDTIGFAPPPSAPRLLPSGDADTMSTMSVHADSHGAAEDIVQPGTHSREVLRELAFTDEEITHFISAKGIMQTDAAPTASSRL